MGYETKFKLKIHDSSPVPETDYHKAQIVESFYSAYYDDALFEGNYNQWTDWMKWYDWQEELLEFSKQFPDIVFELKGSGEEKEDIWDCYFKNGECQYAEAEIILEEYDETKLE